MAHETCYGSVNDLLESSGMTELDKVGVMLLCDRIRDQSQLDRNKILMFIIESSTLQHSETLDVTASVAITALAQNFPHQRKLLAKYIEGIMKGVDHLEQRIEKGPDKK